MDDNQILKHKHGLGEITKALWRSKGKLTPTIKRLIASCPDINAYTAHGDMLLHYVMYYGDVNAIDCIQAFIEAGADVNSKNANGQTCLHLAVMQGYVNIINLLLDHGADINAEDNNGWSALTYAIRTHYKTADTDIACIKALIAGGAKLDLERANKHSYTPLMEAAVMGRLDICIELVKAGANIYVKDPNGWGPATLARWMGHNQTAEYFKAIKRAERVEKAATNPDMATGFDCER